MGVKLKRYCRGHGTWRVFLVRVCLISAFCLFFYFAPLVYWVGWLGLELGSHERCNYISE